MGSEVQKKSETDNYEEGNQAIEAPTDTESGDAKVVADDALEDLDDLDDVDFDLDEVENKIAPLALADVESVRYP